MNTYAISFKQTGNSLGLSLSHYQLEDDLRKAIKEGHVLEVERLLGLGIRPHPQVLFLGHLVCDPLHDACLALKEVKSQQKTQFQQIIALLVRADREAFLTRKAPVVLRTEETLATPLHCLIASFDEKSEKERKFLQSILQHDIPLDEEAKELLSFKGCVWDGCSLSYTEKS